MNTSRTSERLSIRRKGTINVSLTFAYGNIVLLHVEIKINKNELPEKLHIQGSVYKAAKTGVDLESLVKGVKL